MCKCQHQSHHQHIMCQRVMQIYHIDGFTCFQIMHGNFLRRKTSQWSSMVPIIVVSGRMVQLNPRILQICHIMQLHTRIPFYMYHLTWPPTISPSWEEA